MLNATLFLPLIAPLLAPSLEPVPAQSLLLRVPDSAFGLWTCSDVATTLEQMQRNDVVRLLQSGEGQMMNELLREMWPGPRSGMQPALELGATLSGEVVVFGLRNGFGVMVEPPGDRTALKAALNGMVSGSELTELETRTVGSAQLTVLGNQYQDEAYPVAVRIDHPEFVGLVRSYEAEDLAIADQLLEPRSEPTKVVQGLRKRRASHGPAGQAELYVDFSFFAEEAKREMQNATSMFGVDPTDLLGLEQTDLYATASLLPGANLNVQGHLSIPSGSLLSAIADTWRPLPSNLLGSFPAQATGAHAVHWDIVAFYDTLLEALAKMEGGEAAANQMQQAMQSGSMMSGADLEKEFFRLLNGQFAVFFTPPKELPADPMDDDFIFERLGLVIGTKNGSMMLDTFDALVETFGGSEYFQDDTLEGIDVRLFKESGDEVTGGIAFAPDYLVLTMTRELLDQSLQALKGEASALGSTRLSAIFDGRTGACYTSAARLGFLRQLYGQAGIEVPEGLESVFDLYVVDSAQRTASGFTFRANLE